VIGGSFTANSDLGGLVGRNASSIANSYASGSTLTALTSSAVYFGGLVGNNLAGTISNSYANSGFVGLNFGGVVGNNTGTISSSFWNTDAPGALVTGTFNGSSTGTTGLNTAGMMTMSNFSGAGWDIANTGASGAVWRIYEGNTMPLLTSFLTPLTAAVGDVVKTYDGIAYSGGVGVSYTPAVPNPPLLGSVTYGGTSQGAVNAGNYSITASGLYSSQFGYDISYLDGILNIQPKVVALSGTKVYDGSATFTGGTNLFVTTGVGAETLVLTGSTSATSKNVGATDLLNIGTLALANGTGGGLASNYTLSGGLTGVISITPLALTGASIAAVNTTYGTSAATGAVTFTNVIGGDIVTSTASIDSPTFSTSGNLNAGSYTQTAGALSGADAGNYTFAGFTSSANYTVNQLALTGTSIAAVNTTYGTSAAAGAVTFGNVIGGDIVTSTASLVGSTFSSSSNLNAGTYNQTTSVITGTDSGNYSFTGYTTPTANYNVSQLALIGSIATGSTVYGSALTPGAANMTNIVGADNITATVSVNTAGNTSTSGNLNAGNHIGIEYVSSLGGTDAGNYTFAGIVGDYNVSQLALTGTIATGSSVYGSALTPGAANLTNVVGADNITATVAVNTSGNTSTSGNLNAGNHTGIEYVSSLGGTDAANYTFAGIVGDYSVSQLALTGTSIAAVNTTYGTSAAAGAVTFGNVIGGDIVTSTASIVSPTYSTSGNLNAGSYNQTATVLGGADSGNYNFVGGFTSSANYMVGQLALTGTSIAAVNTTYGTSAAAGAVTFGNVIGGDIVTSTASIDSPTFSSSGNLNAGSYTQTATVLGGADSGNYSFVGGFTSSANYIVGQLALTGTIATGSSVYGSALTPGAANLTNVVGADNITATIAVNTAGNTSTSGNLNAGSYTGIEYVSSLGGTDAGNYTFAGIVGNYNVSQLALTGASIADVNVPYGTPDSPGAVSFSNVVSGDVVGSTANIVSPSYDSSGNLVGGSYLQSAMVISGADAGNYTFGGYTTLAANYTVDASNSLSNVIEQIVEITDQNDKEDPKKLGEKSSDVVIDQGSNGLPVCS